MLESPLKTSPLMKTMCPARKSFLCCPLLPLTNGDSLSLLVWQGCLKVALFGTNFLLRCNLRNLHQCELELGSIWNGTCATLSSSTRQSASTTSCLQLRRRSSFRNPNLTFLLPLPPLHSISWSPSRAIDWRRRHVLYHHHMTRAAAALHNTMHNDCWNGTEEQTWKMSQLRSRRRHFEMIVSPSIATLR